MPAIDYLGTNIALYIIDCEKLEILETLDSLIDLFINFKKLELFF